MKRLAVVLALWSTILTSCLPSPVFAADLPAGRQGAPGTGEICFTLGDAVRMLRELEAAPSVKAEADACREWQAQEEVKDQTIAEKVRGQEDRIAQLEAEKKAALDQAQANLEAGKKAVAVAAGPWYQRVLSAGKWIAVGIVIGVVAGAGR